MARVIGVNFRAGGKIYYFDPVQFEIHKGDHVIVETSRGIEYGRVVCDPKEVPDKEVTAPLKPVLRPATQRDTEQAEDNKQKEEEAFKKCRQMIFDHKLDMKLIDAEYTFDNGKILFYFTADGRVDFRDLVKDLAAVFKTRIELRQVGVRDETKVLGGIGVCGRELCCHSYLTDFAPVSIKMAKEQNLSLNPTKISGVCGRLMCCLNNEEETYEELNKHLPKVGEEVITPDGDSGMAASVNVLRQTVKVLLEIDDEKELKEYRADELTFTHRKKPKKAKEDQQPKAEKQQDNQGGERRKQDKQKPENKQPQERQPQEKQPQERPAQDGQKGGGKRHDNPGNRKPQVDGEVKAENEGKKRNRRFRNRQNKGQNENPENAGGGKQHE
ncbi:MAG: stage 0 sporulation protein [Lachnospiraceae bacterium]|nr:stage 0 sporulation protein [Lachnospiraceae bacterium]